MSFLKVIKEVARVLYENLIVGKMFNPDGAVSSLAKHELIQVMEAEEKK